MTGTEQSCQARRAERHSGRSLPSIPHDRSGRYQEFWTKTFRESSRPMTYGELQSEGDEDLSAGGVGRAQEYHAVGDHQAILRREGEITVGKDDRANGHAGVG